MPANRQPFAFYALCLGLLAGSQAVLLPASQARNMWDINHGMTNPPVPSQMASPGMRSPGAPGPSGQVQQYTPDFWNKFSEERIPAGTVLTVVLENNLSSATSKPGDVFTLTVEHPFRLNGKDLIPAGSKIVGAVNFTVPAASLKGGHPGRMEISLQSLVFPDGRHTQIFGFVDANMAQKQSAPVKVKHLGHSLADYGQSVTAMGMSFIAGPGFMAGKLNRGNDFHLDAGEVLPVRLNRDLELPAAPPVMAQPPVMRGASASGVPAAPGVPVTAPGYLDPQGPFRVPGFVPATANGAPPTPVPSYPNNPASDPNAIFNQPLNSAPQVPNTPDPF